MTGADKRPEAGDHVPPLMGDVQAPLRKRRQLEMEQQELNERLLYLKRELERKAEELTVVDRQLYLLRRRAEVAAAAEADGGDRPRVPRGRHLARPEDVSQTQRVVATSRAGRQTPSSDPGALARAADVASSVKESCFEIDPEKAQTPAEFVEAMNRLKAWSGLSLRKLEERAGPGKLPHSSLADALKKKDRLPDPVLVRAFAGACGLKKAEVNTWEAHCRNLAVRRYDPPVAEDPPSRWSRIRTGLSRMCMLAMTREGRMLLICAAAAVWPIVSFSLFPEVGTAAGNVRIMGAGFVGTTLSSGVYRKVLIRRRIRQGSG
ncbi:hypothetical protein ABH920_004750 [Catenulispora sp. EB89]|uniref:hypothetical protein n=1 Tax=Catenulispora sp. EB89 TaxID=3156257 RepID=UPI003512EED7